MREQLKQLKILRNVMHQKMERKVGRGKKMTVTMVYKYNSKQDQEIRKNIDNEIKKLSGSDSREGC